MKLLEAVNLVLPKLGEHRVTRLDIKHPTLAIILPEIENEIKRLLSRGWWFNEFDTKLYPNNQGEIFLGTNVLTFTPKCSMEAVQRGNQLYNPKTLSYSFDAPVEARIREYVEFEQLPESAAQAVYFTALVTCYGTDIGMTQEVQMWVASAASAQSDLLAEHLRQKKYNTKQTRQYARLAYALRG